MALVATDMHRRIQFKFRGLGQAATYMLYDMLAHRRHRHAPAERDAYRLAPRVSDFWNPEQDQYVLGVSW
jgi:hypothetical protein